MSTSLAPKYPVTTASARLPGFVRLATTASMPDVPVPEMASVNAPCGAPNVRASFPRMSSRSATRSGSRCDRGAAPSAASTRAETGDGPGPSRSRSEVGSRLLSLDRGGRNTARHFDRLGDLRLRAIRRGKQRRSDRTATVADDIERVLETGHAVRRTDELGDKSHAPLKRQCVRMTARPDVLEQRHHLVRKNIGHRENCAG